jgi:protein-arginine kinase activator protein McsA
MRQEMASPQSTSRCAQCGKRLRHIKLQVRRVLCMECYDERRYRKQSAPFARGTDPEHLA